jgi:hypothetical protein
MRSMSGASNFTTASWITSGWWTCRAPTPGAGRSWIEEDPDIIVSDVSFISMTKALPAVMDLAVRARRWWR